MPDCYSSYSRKTEIGGNLKRLAAQASLQATSENQILTPFALYEWAKKKLAETEIFFCSKMDYEKTAVALRSRFEEAKTIPGTQKYHSYVPTTEMTIILRQFSSSLETTAFPKNKKNTQTAQVRKRCEK